jgi:hypothetical protein
VEKSENSGTMHQLSPRSLSLAPDMGGKARQYPDRGADFHGYCLWPEREDRFLSSGLFHVFSAIRVMKHKKSPAITKCEKG